MAVLSEAERLATASRGKTGSKTAGKSTIEISIPERLELVVLPTEQCNFRCTYCFQDLPPHRMSPATVRGLEGWLSARAAGLEALTLHWYGGEPLLASEIVEQVQGHASSLSVAGSGFRLRGTITTNGYLLRPGLLSRLVEVGLTQFQVTLDGTRDSHDRTRVLAGGQGTFDRIWENLLGAREIGREFRIVVRVHVCRTNREDVRELLETFRDAFGGDRRFGVLIRGLFRCGGSSESCGEVLSDSEASSSVAALRRHAEALGIAARCGGDSRCRVPLPDNFVVRADGRLGKCPVTLDHPANTAV